MEEYEELATRTQYFSKIETDTNLQADLEEAKVCILHKQRKIQELEEYRAINTQTREELNIIQASLNEAIKNHEEEMNIKDQEKVHLKKVDQRIKLLRQNNAEVEAALSDFCTKYFEVAGLKSKKRANIDTFFTESTPKVIYMTLLETIKILVAKTNEDTPYLEISPEIWLPYVELLLHAQLIEKDPHDGSFIRLVQFNK